MTSKVPEAVKAYYEALDASQRLQLLKIRHHILKQIPNAVEAMKYNMPTFVVEGTPICGILANKKHIGFYPYAGNLIREIPEIAEAFKFTTGAWHIPYSDPLPYFEIDLILREKLNRVQK